MSDTNDSGHYEGALLEEIRDDIKTLLEGQQSLAHVPGDLAQLKDDITIVKADIKTVKNVVTNHEKRIAKIERVI